MGAARGARDRPGLLGVVRRSQRAAGRRWRLQARDRDRGRRVVNRLCFLLGSSAGRLRVALGLLFSGALLILLGEPIRERFGDRFVKTLFAQRIANRFRLSLVAQLIDGLFGNAEIAQRLFSDLGRRLRHVFRGGRLFKRFGKLIKLLGQVLPFRFTELIELLLVFFDKPLGFGKITGGERLGERRTAFEFARI